MSESEWRPRIERLASELRAACEDALPSEELRLDDRSGTMWAEEEDPNVAPHWPIGEIFRFRLRARRVRHLFGWRWLPIRFWRTALEFGAEEMWNAPLWATKQGVWCAVRDERLVAIALPIMSAFSVTHRIALDFSGASKDP